MKESVGDNVRPVERRTEEGVDGRVDRGPRLKWHGDADQLRIFSESRKRLFKKFLRLGDKHVRIDEYEEFSRRKFRARILGLAEGLSTRLVPDGYLRAMRSGDIERLVFTPAVGDYHFVRD